MVMTIISPSPPATVDIGRQSQIIRVHFLKLMGLNLSLAKLQVK